MSKLFRPCLYLDVFLRVHEIPIGVLRLADEVDQLLFKLNIGNVLVVLSDADLTRVDVPGSVAEEVLTDGILQRTTIGGIVEEEGVVG